MRTIIQSLSLLFFAIPLFAQSIGGVAEKARTKFDWGMKATVVCSESPLRDILNEWAKTYKFGVIVDRRIDPDTPFSYVGTGKSLDLVLSEAAENNGLSYFNLGSLAYIGPEGAAGELAVIVSAIDAKFETMSEPAKNRLLRKLALRTKMLETPQDALLKIVPQNDVISWHELEAVPHDLWPGLNLTSNTRSDLLCVLLFTLERTFLVSKNGKSITTTKISEEMSFTLDYPSDFDVEKLGADVNIKKDGSIQKVRGTLRELGKIETAILHEKRKALADIQEAGRKRGETRASRFERLKLQNTALEILKYMAKYWELDLEIESDTIEQLSLDAPLLFEIENAGMNDVLKKILEPRGGTYEINGDTLKIRRTRH